MDPVRDADDLLSADMGVFRGIAYGKEAGELIPFRRMHKPFHMFCLVGNGDAEGTGKTFRCGCQEDVFHSSPGRGKVVEGTLAGTGGSPSGGKRAGPHNHSREACAAALAGHPQTWRTRPHPCCPPPSQCRDPGWRWYCQPREPQALQCSPCRSQLQIRTGASDHWSEP